MSDRNYIPWGFHSKGYCSICGSDDVPVARWTADDYFYGVGICEVCAKDIANRLALMAKSNQSYCIRIQEDLYR